MSTVQETLLPAAMVPGLVTVEDKDGKRQNLWPIDAKELINSGDYKLVENGAIEAARMAATPLRSGMASGLNPDVIVAEVSGIEGRIVAGVDAKDAEAIRASGDSADANDEPSAAPPVGATAHRESLAPLTGGTAGTDVKDGEGASAPKPAAKPAAKSGDDNK